MLEASWDCLAPFGRFIEIGKVDIRSNSRLPMAGFGANRTFAAVDMFYISLHNRALQLRLLKQVMSLFPSGHIVGPRPLHIFPVSKVEEALRLMQSGKNTGRIVISINAAESVPVRSIISLLLLECILVAQKLTSLLETSQAQGNLELRFQSDLHGSWWPWRTRSRYYQVDGLEGREVRARTISIGSKDTSCKRLDQYPCSQRCQDPGATLQCFVCCRPFPSIAGLQRPSSHQGMY